MEGDHGHDNVEFSAYTSLTDPILQLIQQANKTDSILQQLHQQATANLLPRSYSVKGDLICYDNHMLVPGNDDLNHMILHKFHYTPLVRHGGILKTCNTQGLK